MGRTAMARAAPMMLAAAFAAADGPSTPMNLAPLELRPSTQAMAPERPVEQEIRAEKPAERAIRVILPSPYRR